MKKPLYVFLILLSLTLFSQETINQYHFPKIKSAITMPVRIPLSEITKMVNTSVNGLIYEDNSYTDNNDDQFKVKVWKSNPIRIVGGTNQNVLIEVPLKVWAEKGIGKFGVYTYQETSFEATMFFNTSITLNQNWTITTVTQPNGFKWVNKPVLDFGKIKIPITSMVESSLKTQQADFCKIIDEKMASQLNFQSYALMAWNLFSQPFHVSEEYNTWLKITPQNVMVTPMKFYANAIDLNIGIETYSETITGTKPLSSQLLNKIPNFTYIPYLDNKFLLQTTSNIPFSEATSIAKEMFLNKTFEFREGRSNVTIKDIKVYSEGEKIIIEAETEGSVEGISLISGIPVYDKAKHMVVLSDTRYKLKSSNILQKAVATLFQGKIVRMIQEEYGIPTTDIEKDSKKSAEETFNNTYSGLKMTGKINRLEPSKVLLSPEGITAVIDMEAQLNVLFTGF